MSQTNHATTIAAYTNAYQEIEQELAGATEAQLRWKASPASWSLTEVLAHLVDHSIVVSFRLREILAGSAVRLPAFDQDAWVAGQKANDYEIPHLLKAAHALVQYNSQLLSRLSEEEWHKSGVNAAGVTVTIAEIIPAFIQHIQVHLGQIRRIKQAQPEEQVS